MDPVLQPPRIQLHLHQGLQCHDLKVGGRLGLADVRRHRHVLRPNLLAAKEQMNRVLHASVGPVEECINVQDLDVDPACRFHGFLRCIEIAAANQDVHIACVAYGSVVDASHPLGDRVAADDCVRHAGL